MKKTQILPIISVVCLAIGTITGHAVSADLQNEIADISAVVIGAGLSIWGIYKNHEGKKGDQK